MYIYLFICKRESPISGETIQGIVAKEVASVGIGKTEKSMGKFLPFIETKCMC